LIDAVNKREVIVKNGYFIKISDGADITFDVTYTAPDTGGGAGSGPVTGDPSVKTGKENSPSIYLERNTVYSLDERAFFIHIDTSTLYKNQFYEYTGTDTDKPASIDRSGETNDSKLYLSTDDRYSRLRSAKVTIPGHWCSFYNMTSDPGDDNVSVVSNVTNAAVTDMSYDEDTTIDDEYKKTYFYLENTSDDDGRKCIIHIANLHKNIDDITSSKLNVNIFFVPDESGYPSVNNGMVVNGADENIVRISESYLATTSVFRSQYTATSYELREDGDEIFYKLKTESNEVTYAPSDVGMKLKFWLTPGDGTNKCVTDGSAIEN
jgi:hypothetical protein